MKRPTNGSVTKLGRRLAAPVLAGSTAVFSLGLLLSCANVDGPTLLDETGELATRGQALTDLDEPPLGIDPAFLPPADPPGTWPRIDAPDVIEFVASRERAESGAEREGPWCTTLSRDSEPTESRLRTPELPPGQGRPSPDGPFYLDWPFDGELHNLNPDPTSAAEAIARVSVELAERDAVIATDGREPESEEERYLAKSEAWERWIDAREVH